MYAGAPSAASATTTTWSRTGSTSPLSAQTGTRFPWAPGGHRWSGHVADRQHRRGPRSRSAATSPPSTARATPATGWAWSRPRVTARPTSRWRSTKWSATGVQPVWLPTTRPTVPSRLSRPTPTTSTAPASPTRARRAAPSRACSPLPGTAARPPGSTTATVTPTTSPPSGRSSTPPVTPTTARTSTGSARAPEASATIPTTGPSPTPRPRPGRSGGSPTSGRYQNYEGLPAPTMLGWYPSFNAGTFTGQAQGPWTVTGNDDYVVFGGEFTRVDNKTQQGLVRFGVSDGPENPNAEGPQYFGATYPIKAASTESGTVRINWSTNRDDDNETLTYRVAPPTAGRGRTSQLVGSRAQRLRPASGTPRRWGTADTGLTPGTAYEYRVQARDPTSATPPTLPGRRSPSPGAAPTATTSRLCTPTSRRTGGGSATRAASGTAPPTTGSASRRSRRVRAWPAVPRVPWPVTQTAPSASAVPTADRQRPATSR